MTDVANLSRLYQALRHQGFTPAQAVSMVAISGAESQGWHLDAVGDKSLETATWGPSIGLFQIRTLRSETGKGTPRDINYLTGNFNHQVAAARAVYLDQGFNAWSVYRTGSYKRYLGVAKGIKLGNEPLLQGKKPWKPGKPAPIVGPRPQTIPRSKTPAPAGGAGGTATAQNVGLPGIAGQFFDPLPWAGALPWALNKAGDAATTGAEKVAAGLWSQIQPFVLTSMFITAGLGLVVVGLVITAQPTFKKTMADTQAAASTAAMAAI